MDRTVQSTQSQLLDLQDKLSMDFRSVSAILECARILTALESMPSFNHPRTGMTCGEGCANGNELLKDSLTDLLYLGRTMVDDLNQKAQATLDKVRKTEVSHD